MKRTNSKSLSLGLAVTLLVLLLSTVLSVNAFAATATNEFTVDKLTYTILTEPTSTKAGTVELSDNNLSSLTTELTIPAEVVNNEKTYQVTSIAKDALSGNTKLKTIVIPNTVTVIGRAAFKGNTALTSVNIPFSVTEIGRDAFMNCTKLQSITIPYSVLMYTKPPNS